MKPTRNEQNDAHSAGEPCEVLFDLYQGRTGAVRLGRYLQGRNAGRLVMLRPINADAARRATRLVSQVRNISHPKLLKVMDCVRVSGQHYIASEYISGVCYSEMRRKLQLESTKELAALLRVARDVLSAAHSGRRLLEGLYGQRVERAIYEDTIWVADFGEAFVTELGIFEAILSEQAFGSGVRAPYLPHSEAAACDDVRFMGSLLFDVLSRPSRAGAALLGLPKQTNKALAGLVTLAASADADARPPTPAAMAEGLAQLPPGLEATSADVSRFLSRLMGTELKNRHQKLSLFERASAVAREDDRTQFHRASGLNQIGACETAPPGPPRSGIAETNIASAATIPSLRVPSVHVDEPDASVPAGPLPCPPDAEVSRVRAQHRATSARRAELPKEQRTTQRALPVAPPPSRRKVSHESSRVLAPMVSRAPVRPLAKAPVSTPADTLGREGEGLSETPRDPLERDAPTTVWTANVTQNQVAPTFDEDATTLYLASKEVPAEPSVIIQDHDETNLYLRAKTGQVAQEGQFAVEPTTISGRRSREVLQRHLARRRLLTRIIVLLVLLMLSALVTVLMARFGWPTGPLG